MKSRWYGLSVISKSQSKEHREPSERSPGRDLGTTPFPVGCCCLAVKSHPTLLQPQGLWAQVVLVVKSLPANAGDVRDPGSIPWVGKITWRRKYSRILAWRIPGTEEPGGLPESMGSQSQAWLRDWAHAHTPFMLLILPPPSSCSCTSDLNNEVSPQWKAFYFRFLLSGENIHLPNIGPGKRGIEARLKIVNRI